MNTLDEMKYRIIEKVMESRSFIIDALYEILVNEDYDFIPDLFDSKEEFEEFIEKWTPKKCCVKEEDND